MLSENQNHAQVELTWDETDPNRGKAMKRAFEVLIHMYHNDLVEMKGPK